MRVLVADADAVNRRMLATALAAWGYRVDLAEDGDQAWETLAAATAPVLAVLDWHLPGLPAPELCRKLRARTDAAPLHLIVATPQDDQEAPWEGLKLGANDYLGKPYQAQELQLRVQAGARRLAADAQRADAQKMLEALERTRKICHDLNQPLQVACFCLDDLLEALEDSPHSPLLERVREALDRMTELTREISQTARGATADYLARATPAREELGRRAA